MPNQKLCKIFFGKGYFLIFCDLFNTLIINLINIIFKLLLS
jgi:hypothetical protein